MRSAPGMPAASHRLRRAGSELGSEFGVLAFGRLQIDRVRGSDELLRDTDHSIRFSSRVSSCGRWKRPVRRYKPEPFKMLASTDPARPSATCRRCTASNSAKAVIWVSERVATARRLGRPFQRSGRRRCPHARRMLDQ